jgi:hypothetical protein
MKLVMSFCVLLVFATYSRGDLIINGSFESPVVPNGGFTNFLAGSTAITGWTVVGIDTSVISTTFTQSGITFQAQSGSQWADLAGVTSNSMLSGVSQSVPTSIGTAYDLQFYVGSATDGVLFFPATIDVSIDGGARTSFTNLNAPNNMLDWQQVSFSFIAQNANTNITLFNGGAPNNFNSALDNVTLTAVPEPDVIALFMVACAIGICRTTARHLRQFANLSIT